MESYRRRLESLRDRTESYEPRQFDLTVQENSKIAQAQPHAGQLMKLLKYEYQDFKAQIDEMKVPASKRRLEREIELEMM